MWHSTVQALTVWVFFRPLVKQRSWHLEALGLPACSLEAEQRQEQSPQQSQGQSGRPACPSGSQPGPGTCLVLQTPPVTLITSALM